MHQPKDTDWLGRWKQVPACTSTHHTALPGSPNCMQLLYTVRLIMFPLWLAILIIFYFLSGSSVWKLINIFHYYDYVDYYSFNTIVWASLIAQSVKNLPAVQETPVRFLSWEDALEKEMAVHSSVLAWKIPWSLAGYSHAVARVGRGLATKPPPPPIPLNHDWSIEK